MATVSGAASAGFMGHGARTGPRRSMAAVLRRVLPATPEKLPAMNAVASFAEMPRISLVPELLIHVETDPSMALTAPKAVPLTGLPDAPAMYTVSSCWSTDIKPQFHPEQAWGATTGRQVVSRAPVVLSRAARKRCA